MLILPVPPSVNHYWIRTRKGSALSEAGRTYKALVALQCRAMNLAPIQTGTLGLHIAVYRPAKRGDIDNYLKGILDALKGYVFNDDSQVVKLIVERFDDKANPRVEVELL